MDANLLLNSLQAIVIKSRNLFSLRSKITNRGIQKGEQMGDFRVDGYNRQPSSSIKDTITLYQPPYCECARFGKRPLSWFTWVPGMSDSKDNSFIERNNLELSHEHLFFDQSGDNIGFGPKGYFSENDGNYKYKYEKECFDGALMRKALLKVKDMSSYFIVSSNCQVFAERIRGIYNMLLKAN